MMHQPIVTISEDYGGRVIDYVERVERWHKEGVIIKIKGACTSACTLVLGLPKDKVCVGANAVLGFHKASGAWGTANLLHAYPAKVKAWLDQRGGLSTEVKWATGDEPRKIVTGCDRLRTLF